MPPQIPHPSDEIKNFCEAWPLENLHNIGFCVTETARRLPLATAVAAPRKDVFQFAQRLLFRPLPHRTNTRFDSITFDELEATSNQVARGLIAQGLIRQTRIALMVPPGIEFVSWVFGLFKAGMVVILIDPGMGKKNMIRCLADAQPEGLVGIPLAHLVRSLFRSRLPKCRHNIVLGHWPGCLRASEFTRLPSTPISLPNQDREQPAAIIFTTGSTGPPKGVLYRHRVFIEQARQIRDYFQIKPGTVDVSGFPLFALFNTAMGATTVFPKMDATRPASVHPPEIIHAIESFAANQSFGSPALWNTVTRYCVKHSLLLPSIKRVLSAGAPVPAELLDRIKNLIGSDGEVFTPYGATEALPVACISASEVLNETANRSRHGAGTCVGRPFPDMHWRVIEISDTPLPTVRDCHFLPTGQIGELIVQGNVVTDQYVTRTEANAEHKIQDECGSNQPGEQPFWHRMGDVGYLDEAGRFWFCGRKGHRVQTNAGTLFTIPCEAIFNNHPKIYRSALVGVRTQAAGLNGFESETPVVIAEPYPEHWTNSPRAQQVLIDELRELGRGNELTASIEHILLHRSLPVDIRHNSKIFREQLRPWAAKRIVMG